jgi:hypothetical protein
MRSIAVSAAVVLAVLVSPHHAAAAGKRFVTALLGTGPTEAFVCSVINLDKKPITADVKLVGRDGNPITVNETDCDVPIAPNAGCRAASTPAVRTGYCDATVSSGKVRVNLLVIDTDNGNHTTATVPGTLK